MYRNGTSVSATAQRDAIVSGLSCGTVYTLGVDAVDAAGNRSGRTEIKATSSACPDDQAPTTPADITTSSRTTTSIALSWSPSTDNAGTVGYGLYRGGNSVSTTAETTGIFSGLACGTNYTLGVDAIDAAGNRSSPGIVMVSTTSCADAAFYVSTTGSDTNPGSDALPFRTIQHGLDVAQPGETVIVKPGSYAPASFVRSGTATAPITLKAQYAATNSATSQHAVLTSSTFGVGTGLGDDDFDHVIIEGFDTSNFSAGIQLSGGADYNIIRNTFAYGNDGSGIMLYGGSYNLFEHNHLLDRGPSDPEAGAVQDYGIALYGYGTRVNHNYFFGNHNQSCSFKEQLDSTYVGYNTFEGAMITALYLGQNDDNTGNDAPGVMPPAGRDHRIQRLPRRDRLRSVLPHEQPDHDPQHPECGRAPELHRESPDLRDVGEAGDRVHRRGPGTNGAKIYGNTIVNQRRADPHAGGGSAPKAIRIEDRGREGATGDVIEIYNNSFYDTDMALSVVGGSSGQMLVVKNNDFVQAGSFGAEGDLSHTTLGYNNWWPQASVHVASDTSVDPLTVGPLTVYDPFANPGPSPVYDPVSNQLAYKLQPDSPLIGAETNVGLKNSGAAGDIGANEFVP